VQVRFANKKLEALYTSEAGAKKYPRGVVSSFFEVVAVLVAAPDERDLYAIKTLRFEALKGDRAGQHSVRLNKQFRFIVQIEVDRGGSVIVVVAIEDYH
jgi:proteic killer suppression protein